jgi:hypothetical protein
MPEPNGEIPLTGDPRVDAALKRIRGKFQDLEDAMLVQAHLEKRQSESIKAHAEWMEEHEADYKKRIEKYEERMQRIETNLAEATDKLNLMIGREMRREGGPEAGQ